MRVVLHSGAHAGLIARPYLAEQGGVINRAAK